MRSELREFTARYEGVCRACGGAIKPGEQVVKVAGRYAHSVCAKDPEVALQRLWADRAREIAEGKDPIANMCKQKGWGVQEYVDRVSLSHWKEALFIWRAALDALMPDSREAYFNLKQLEERWEQTLPELERKLAAWAYKEGVGRREEEEEEGAEDAPS